MQVAAWYRGRKKVDQSSPKSLRIRYRSIPLTTPNFVAVCQTVYEKSVTIFCTLQFLGAAGDPDPWVKVQQSGWWRTARSLYQADKFRPLSTTPLGDICCQSSSILWTAWPTDRQTDRQRKKNIMVALLHRATITNCKRYSPAFHAATNKLTGAL